MEASLNTISRKQVALLRACRLAGGRTKLAREIGASVSQIGNWINRGDIIPYHYALLIVKATNNLISLNDLCPEMRHVNQLVTRQTVTTQVPLRYIRDDAGKLQTYVKCKFPEKQDQTLLTQPVLVDSDHRLLAFADRLYAHQQAKSVTVPAIVIDVAYHLQTQVPIDSVIRLCSVSERVRVGEIIRQQMLNRRGRPVKNPKARKNISNFKGRSLDIIVQLVGFGNRITYSHAKLVVTQGCSALIQAMDNKQLSISLAAKLAKLSPEQQQILLRQDKKAIRQQINKAVLSPLPPPQSTTRLSSSSTSFTTTQQLVDIIEIYRWLLQQGAPVLLEQQQGGYQLIWQQDK